MLGAGAVEGLLNGQFNKMVGMIDNKICYTSFDDAINKEKHLDPALVRLAEILAM